MHAEVEKSIWIIREQRKTACISPYEVTGFTGAPVEII